MITSSTESAKLSAHRCVESALSYKMECVLFVVLLYIHTCDELRTWTYSKQFVLKVADESRSRGAEFNTRLWLQFLIVQSNLTLSGGQWMDSRMMSHLSSSLSFFLSASLSFYLCISLCISLSVSLCISLSLSIYLSIYITLSLLSFWDSLGKHGIGLKSWRCPNASKN